MGTNESFVSCNVELILIGYKIVGVSIATLSSNPLRSDIVGA